MPHIEELPTTAKAAAPGWSYVVDTGYDPSKAAINPTNRKRARNAAAGGLSQGDLTVRQQTAIQRHLDDLDKDSHKPVNIAPPKINRKQTQNTRRILASGKDFSHYLDQEEAALALKHTSQDADTDAPSKPAQRASKTPIARRKPQIVAEPSPVPTPTAAAAAAAAPQTPSAPVTPASLSVHLAPIALPQNNRNELLISPAAPPSATAAEIEALLSAPPLSYNAARSAPASSAAPPQRVFCEICGYWGRVRCLRCGSRVCGLECKSAHEESRCIRF